jgi:hypothetical protein
MKIIYNTQNGNILASLTKDQKAEKVLSNFVNAEIKEIKTNISIDEITKYRLDLDTFELELKPTIFEL